MKSDIQIKVILGFSNSNYRKINERLPENRKIKIGYDIYPYSVSVWTDDISTFRKVDPMYGVITYVGAFLHLDDLIMCAGNSMIENKRPVGMIWDTLIDKEL